MLPEYATKDKTPECEADIPDPVLADLTPGGSPPGDRWDPFPIRSFGSIGEWAVLGSNQ